MNRTLKLWHLQSSGIDGNTGFYKFTVCDEDGREIVNARQSVLGTTYTELEANAHLISAAPELLEACRKAETAIDLHCYLSGDERMNAEMEAVSAIRQAIAKAIGQELKAPAISENLNQPL